MAERSGLLASFSLRVHASELIWWFSREPRDVRDHPSYALIYTREELWAPDMASYAGDYVADECGAHVTLHWEGSQLMSDDFGDRQVFVPGVKGELVGIDPMVLRVPLDGSTSSFASGRPGFKDLMFRRVGRQ